MDVTQEKETYIDEAKRRIAHLSYKLEQAEGRIRSLEYDNADLQKWVNDTCVPRMVEMNEELMNKYNQKRYRSTNFKQEYGRAPGRR
jgi:hypothetical protein